MPSLIGSIVFLGLFIEIQDVLQHDIRIDRCDMHDDRDLRIFALGHDIATFDDLILEACQRLFIRKLHLVFDWTFRSVYIADGT